MLFSVHFSRDGWVFVFFFFFQAEDGIRDGTVTGVQTCALPICNRDLPAREVTEILAGLGVARDKPLLVQIGPFARAHDPLGVVNAYRLVEKHHDVRLFLAGTADDEPERLELLSQLREVAHEDPDVVVLELPAEAHRQINALQRAATIVLQKSVRGGFDLGPAEAMWKGKPVVGGY